jgi:hypothetical protein
MPPINRQKSKRRFGECTYSRTFMEYSINSFEVDARTGVPRVICPGCSKRVGFIKFTPNLEKGTASGVHPYHKVEVKPAPYYDEVTDLLPEEVLATIMRQASSAPKGQVTIRAVDVRMMVREIARYRSGIVFTPAPTVPVQ